ncbi:MAG: HAD-IC family P-type ATPase [Candidatus Omnitrophica bacterium]|nr:HAD-IC family P-type ATPase [Candidatus Omnitrophota bacterium]
MEKKQHTTFPPQDKLSAPWASPSGDVLDELGIDARKGVSEQEVPRRRGQWGPNRIRTEKKKSAWAILINQFKSVIIILLLAAAVISFFFEGWVQAAAIAVALFLNAAVGFFTELKASRSMEALQKLSRVKTVVRRNGEARQIDAEDLVPGDIVLLNEGDIVSADLRILEASKLQANESALTGESMPVSKQEKPCAEDAPLHDRRSMLWKGTTLLRGSGEAVVTATGMETELGNISSLAEEAGEEKTPLEKKLNRLGHVLLWVTGAVAALLAVSGILAGKEAYLMIETAIVLAIAAIPEGLPVVATIALARGMWRMARENAIVEKLAAVETLGSTDIICTDKTGTLTENRMEVSVLHPSGAEPVRTRFTGEEGEGFFEQSSRIEVKDRPRVNDLIRCGVLCNNASFSRTDPEKTVGDPLEVALLQAGELAGIGKDALKRRFPEQREEAFDSERKMMATYNGQDAPFLVLVKGAPEEVIAACGRYRTESKESSFSAEAKERWGRISRDYAKKGLRMLACAEKRVHQLAEEPYADLVFLGLVGFFDPPRGEIRSSLAECARAGIRTVMVTGDQADTAEAVAADLGLDQDRTLRAVEGKDLKSPDDMSESELNEILDVPIFARVTPGQKLDLIEMYQKKRHVVAMTGDGVNDAPALKKADIGIAMGQRGTQVAREAADIVLQDDSFPTIVRAVAQGRVIFGNIRKFIVYLLPCHVSEIAAVGIASVLRLPLPLLPLQILFLNLVTDVFPALALGMGEGDPRVMEHPPRSPDEQVLTRAHWAAVFVYGVLMGLAVFGCFTYVLFVMKADPARAVTVAYFSLGLASLWHVFNVRDRHSRIFRNEVTRNRFVWAALLLGIILLSLSLYVPFLARVLKTVPLTGGEWALAFGTSLVPLAAAQVLKKLKVM